MKALIFAAGLGTRLRPFTLGHPKALVPVAGIPMLQRVIANVAEAGINDIVVNVHHFASQIVEFLDKNHNFGLNIAVSDESDELLDTGGGLLKAHHLLDGPEPVLLHNADILTDLPLSLITDAHRDAGSIATLLCSRRRSSRCLWFRNSDDHLAGWENLKTGELKPAGFIPADGYDASPFDGIHVVSPSIFPYLEDYNRQLATAANRQGDIVPFSIVPFYLSSLGQVDIRRFMLPAGCHWFDVGSSEKLAAAEKALGTI